MLEKVTENIARKAKAPTTVELLIESPCEVIYSKLCIYMPMNSRLGDRRMGNAYREVLG